MDADYVKSLPKEKADRLKKIPKATLEAHAFCSACGQEMRLHHVTRAAFDPKTGAKSEADAWSLRCIAWDVGHDDVPI